MLENIAEFNNVDDESKIVGRAELFNRSWKQFISGESDLNHSYRAVLSKAIEDEDVYGQDGTLYHFAEEANEILTDEYTRMYSWIQSTAQEIVLKNPYLLRLQLWNFKRKFKNTKDFYRITDLTQDILYQHKCIHENRNDDFSQEDTVHVVKILSDLLEMYVHSPELRDEVVIAASDKRRKQNKLKSRRRFLIDAGLATAATAIYTASAKSELTSAVRAMFSRPIDAAVPQSEYGPVRHEFYKSLYETYSSECPNLLYSHFTHILDSLNRIAMNYFVQWETPPTDFEHFMKNFLDNIHQETQKKGFNFEQFLLLLIPIAENTTISPLKHNNLKSDVLIGDAQLLTDALESISGDTGAVTNAFADRRSSTKYLMRAASERLPMTYLEIIRIAGCITLGMGDIEALTYAQGYSELSDEAKAQMQVDHPRVTASYDRLMTEKYVFEEKRDELEALADEYVNLYAERLSPFFVEFSEEKPNKHWEALGLSIDHIDAWHMVNPTMTWSYLHGMSGFVDTLPDDEALKTMVASTHSLYRDIEYFSEGNSEQALREQAKTFLSQQILNKKLLPFLLKQAVTENEKKLVKSMQRALDAYTEQGATLNIAENETTALIGRLELDVPFQIENTVSGYRFFAHQVEKYLGEWSRETRNGSLYAFFCTVAVWEFTSKYMVSQGEVFARYTKVDPIYDFEGVLNEIQAIVDLAKDSGILENDPQEDFNSFYNLLINLREFDTAPDNIDSRVWFTLREAYHNRLAPAPYSSIDRALATIGWYFDVELIDREVREQIEDDSDHDENTSTSQNGFTSGSIPY